MKTHLSLFAALVLSSFLSQAAPPPHKTKHVIFVMTDGLRWQEVFGGAEESLMKSENHDEKDEKKSAALRAKYWRDTAEGRRQTLMPFLWSVVARDGQIYGNRKQGSEAYVTNGLNFSYPGYNETLCGFPDPRINSNDKVLNPNMTVLEWLNGKPAFHGKVAAFGAWDTFDAIFNAPRAGFVVNSGYDPLALPGDARIELLNQLKADGPRIWDDEPFDSIPFYTALEYLKVRKPTVLYLSLGETDDWAHEGKYTEYLDAARRVDQYLEKIWETVQSMPEYRGNTTLIFSPDHGRGDAPVDWKSHGEKLPDSKYIWMAFLGPDTPAMGMRTNVPAVTQNQIAATLAEFLGQDYHEAVPKAGKPIADAMRH